MPILAGTSTGPGPGAGAGGQPVVQPGATWYAPDGTVWPLMNEALGWVTIKSPAGLDDNPIAVTTDARPRGGAAVRHIQPQPRIITWPLRVWADTSAELAARWQALADAFTQTEDYGPGILEIARPGRPRRQIRAHYQEGFDDDVDLLTLKQGIVTLFCEDPYWFDPVPLSIRREHGEAVDFLQPYPSVSSSQVLGATTLHNPGKVAAWPEWVITGPASEITATLEATGESWTLTPADISGTFAAGDEIRISTDPPRVRYHPSGGGPAENWTGALDWPTAVLWGLPRGSSAVTFQVSGADDGTSITLSFHARYRTS